MENEYAFLKGIMADQEEFERGITGTDGSLYDFNDPEFILNRGVIGEAREALEALVHGTLFEAKVEAVDILIFLSSLFNHLDMSAEEVQLLARTKMKHNYNKYARENFEGKTVAEGIQASRDKYNGHHETDQQELENTIIIYDSSSPEVKE